VVVGVRDGRACLWTAAIGAVDISAVLAFHGVDLDRWTLTVAIRVSSDGLTIAGQGVHEHIPGSWRQEGWVATLPILPLSKPVPQSICSGGTAELSVRIASAEPVSYQWQLRDLTAPGGWIALTDGPWSVGGVPCGELAGAQSDVLHVTTSTTWNGIRAFTFRCVASNTCASTYVAPATITICAADYDCDGEVTVADLFYYLTGWFANDERATRFAGAAGMSALFTYLAEWFRGCGD
jgi:hypothetical protein